ncbi:MAG: histidine kinase [Bacteroidia bacterium]|jgi:signal transduction histidine kinase|nr:histidine kinase [Bacteroidia bacterium]
MKFVFTYLLLAFSVACFAQLQRNYTSYTVDNGLAQNTVWDVFQDYKGFMWFGTADGIDRFDGYKMHHYKFSQFDTASILGNSAFHFLETKNHQLWISHNKGISVYNRAKNNFYNVHIFPDSFNNGDSYATLIGQDHDGNMWCITNTQQLQCFSNNTLQLLHTINISKSTFQVSSFRKGFIVGKYIVGYFNDSTSSWFRLNIDTKEVNLVYGRSKHTNSIMLYNDSTICIYADKQMTYYDVNSNTIKYKPLQGSLFPTEKSNFTSMVWWQGKIWMGNNTGLFVFDTVTNRFEEHIVSFDKKQKVGFYYVQNLYIDHSNNLWICTNGDGAKCLSPQNNKFKHLPVIAGGSSLVKAISTDTVGTVFSGLYEGGMVWYLNNGQTPHFKLPNKISTNILGLITFNNHLYFVQNENLMVMNLRTQKVVYTEKIYKAQKQRGIGYPVLRINKGKVYLSADAYLFEIQQEFKLKTIHQFELSKHYLTTFQIANDSVWWVGTTQHLLQFNPITKRIKQLPYSLTVKSICLTHNKQSLWLGGNSGLYHLKPNGSVIKRYEAPQDLPDDFIYGILEDNNGKIWMSHNKGLSVYNPLTQTFKHYGVKDGLQSNEFNTGAYYKDEKGLLYFGGVNGINVIDPSHVIENKNAPQISINEILLGDMPYKSDTAYNEITSLTLSYLENTLSFDFSALEFSQPENNIYQYRLAGYDNNWIQSGTKHFARYANLPPGNYVFEVMAANADGFWNKQPRNIFISIIPPFWKRTWFYWLMGLLGFVAVGGAFYAYNLRQQRKLQRELELQQKLEQERLRISRDLHDNVGAQLSYLITNVEWMLQHPDRLTEQDEQQRLQAMSEAGRNAILTLRQTIWAISNTSLKVDDFADRFKQFALKMLEFDRTIHVHFTEQILPNKVLSPAVALNVFRVCQEAFNNCLKHAQSKNVHIHFQSDEKALLAFSIKDDGIGFDWEQAKQKGHYGLINMEARAKETNAELIVASEPGKGTVLTIVLK